MGQRIWCHYPWRALRGLALILIAAHKSPTTVRAFPINVMAPSLGGASSADRRVIGQAQPIRSYARIRPLLETHSYPPGAVRRACC